MSPGVYVAGAACVRAINPRVFCLNRVVGILPTITDMQVVAPADLRLQSESCL